MMWRLASALLFSVLLLLTACGGNNDSLGDITPAPTVKPMSETGQPGEGAVAFRIKNSIGGDIYEVRISPNFQGEFGEDILKDKILKQSESADVYFVPIDSYTYWDLRVLTENGNVYTWQNIIFGSFEEIELRISDSGPEFSTY